MRRYIKPSSDDYLNTFNCVEVKVGSRYSDSKDDLEEAIREFRGLVTKERIMSVLKEHSAYEKPSDKKRRKIREQKRRIRKLDFIKKTEEDLDV